MKFLKSYWPAFTVFTILTLIIVFVIPYFMELEKVTDWVALFAGAGTLSAFAQSCKKDIDAAKKAEEDKKAAAETAKKTTFNGKIETIIGYLQTFKDLGYQYWCSAGMKPADRDLLAKRIEGLEKDISREMTFLHHNFEDTKDAVYEVLNSFVALKMVMTGGNFGSKTFVADPDNCDEITNKASAVVLLLNVLPR